MYSLVLAYSHHQGLPNLNEEGTDSKLCVFGQTTGSQVRNGYGAGSFDTNPSKSYYLRNGSILGKSITKVTFQCFYEWCFRAWWMQIIQIQQVFTDRFLKGKRYRNCCQASPAALDNYVKGLQKKGKSRRNELRMEMYEACRNCISKDGIVSHDGPVGSGKTTAVMAFNCVRPLRGCRAIFLWFYHIQNYCSNLEIYREALVLPGENPKKLWQNYTQKLTFRVIIQGI